MDGEFLAAEYQKMKKFVAAELAKELGNLTEEVAREIKQLVDGKPEIDQLTFIRRVKESPVVNLAMEPAELNEEGALESKEFEWEDMYAGSTPPSPGPQSNPKAIHASTDGMSGGEKDRSFWTSIYDKTSK